MKRGLVMLTAALINLGPAVGPSLAGEFQKKPPYPADRIMTTQLPEAPRSDGPPPRQDSRPSVESASVEDLLLEKGVITMDDWIRIKAEEEYRLAEREKRIDVLEGWKTKIEQSPMLTDKVNVGLNALQFLYTHTDAEVPEGKSKDNFSIRRSKIIFWGKISEHLPRWHALFEFQSINFGRETPNRAGATGDPAAATFSRPSFGSPISTTAPFWPGLRR